MRAAIASIVAIVCFFPNPAQAADDNMLSAPDFATTRTAALEWVAGQKISDPAAKDAIAGLWSEPKTRLAPAALFQRVIDTFALANGETKRFLSKCDPIQPAAIPPNLKPLTDAAGDNEFYKANLTAWFGRYLAQVRYYDEGLQVLKNVDAAATVDPAACLFYTAVCQHQLLRRTDGLKTIERLLDQTENVPARYTRVAELMKYELEQIEEKSIGEVAHLMSDVERRLDLGRGGQDVQKREAKIVATLDEIIERLENQSGGGGGGSNGGQNNNPQNGAQDSSVKGSPGEGEVDEKKQNEGQWGSLDDKAEARAKQMIGRDFPPHYRRAVEEYFRKLARQRAARSR